MIDEVQRIESEESEEKYLPGDSGESIGSILRRARERLGYDPEHVARVLCVRVQLLQNVEEGRYNDIPYADAYVVPFVRSYGEYLELDDVDDLCRGARKELMPLYPSLKILDQEDVHKVGDLPGDDKVSVWEKERFAPKSKQYTSRIWFGAGIIIMIIVGLLSWRFYQARTAEQEVLDLQADQSSASDVAAEPLVQIKSLNSTSEVYVFSPKGTIYDGILTPGKSITLPREPGMRFNVSPSTGWELVVNGKVVPQELALSSPSLDKIAESMNKQ